MIRQWLARLIGDRGAPWPEESGQPWQDVLDVAAAEQVSALVHERLARGDIVCAADLCSGFAAAAREDAVHSLRLESETRRVIELMADAGLPTLLLKGSALAHWLFPSPHLRACADIDLLFATREDAERAVAVLAPAGYQRRERVLPGDLTTYELTCVRTVAGKMVDADLHWGIGGAPVYAACVTAAELFASSQQLPRLSPHARGPEPVHAFLHAAMHRGLNLHLEDDRLKWLYDFHLLAQYFSEDHWRRLLDLAGERGLAGTCLSALLASEACFGTLLPAPAKQVLTELSWTERIDVSRMGSWPYVQWSNLKALPDVRTRCRWLGQRLRPSPGYLQDIYGKPNAAGWSIYLRQGLRKLFH